MCAYTAQLLQYVIAFCTSSLYWMYILPLLCIFDPRLCRYLQRCSLPRSSLHPISCHQELFTSPQWPFLWVCSVLICVCNLFTFSGYLKHHTVPLQVSRITVERSSHFFNSFQHNLQILAYQLPYLESMLTCIGMSWMTILVRTTQQL